MDHSHDTTQALLLQEVRNALAQHGITDADVTTYNNNLGAVNVRVTLRTGGERKQYGMQISLHDALQTDNVSVEHIAKERGERLAREIATDFQTHFYRRANGSIVHTEGVGDIHVELFPEANGHCYVCGTDVSIDEQRFTERLTMLHAEMTTPSPKPLSLQQYLNEDAAPHQRIAARLYLLEKLRRACSCDQFPH